MVMYANEYYHGQCRNDKEQSNVQKPCTWSWMWLFVWSNMRHLFIVISLYTTSNTRIYTLGAYDTNHEFT
jgi:hypothetical protein